MTLDTPISQLHRVGKAMSKRLAALGIHTAVDLLFYFPFRYEDFSQTKPISQLIDGEQVTIRGTVELIANKRSPRKRMIITEAVIADESDIMRVVWFGQPFIAKNLKTGDAVFISGKVNGDVFGKQMVGPVYEKVQNSKFKTQNSTTHTARIVPIYPLTAGITQKQLRFLIKQIIPLAGHMDEWLPEDIRDRADVMELAEAIRAIHFPDTSDELQHAQRRLKFDELFVLQLRAEMIRQSLRVVAAPVLAFMETRIKEFVGSLPFTLTNDQKVAAWEILQDMTRSEPMNRLLEGDVGSGKTVVAAMALYTAVLNGYQTVLVAPTEILAKQHFESIAALMGNFCRIGILTRSEQKIMNKEHREKSKKKNKEKVCIEIAQGNVDIIIGTHAILQEAVSFSRLGLVIIDEQHRFGVEQRKMLKEKSGLVQMMPHFLSMTATPIPRSFALTLYGDLDISIIRHKPPGRKEIKTRLVEPRNRDKAYEFIRQQVKQGRQVFVICPLIDMNQESGIMNHGTEEKKSVLSEFEKLSKKIFSDLRVGYLHGKMPALGKSRLGGKATKEGVMKQFVHGEIDILVSTSVVEVGVNIPNASVMMIEGAERFGLAQLHQFRGRVGRSEHQSYCFLFTDSDSQKALDRLAYFERSTDGFKLAQYDLEQRGPGDVYGTAQSGMMNLKLATMKDVNLIKLARDISRGIDFELYTTFKQKVQQWEQRVHLE